MTFRNNFTLVTILDRLCQFTYAYLSEYSNSNNPRLNLSFDLKLKVKVKFGRGGNI